MAEYGVQVARGNGQLVNLTNRPVMVIDVINVPYGVNGSRNFHIPVSGVGIDIDLDIDPASDGKTISVKHVGNSVTWTWHSAKALKPTNVKIIVFSGG
ncbi:hypothetical protein Q7424_10490 [Glaesserella parasuis]|nr:hypothetical protein [Glaesserella parasuis]MDO9942336.1 hypothetical protein [Glaesserella parasuis]MDP0012488.1 hypothetical protein [Glaesserella parasuis]